MKVFIAERDLFHSVGGGQTVYRRLIETNPQLDFFYLRVNEPESWPRPKNAKPFLLQKAPLLFDAQQFLHALDIPMWFWFYYVEASDIAYSVQGQDFDVIEAADYSLYGSLIRPALQCFGVHVNKSVLSFHGNVSTTFKMDWCGEDWSDVPMNLLENWACRTADIRYAISQSYREEWGEILSLPIQYLHPLRFLHIPSPTLGAGSSEKPSLYFIGRPEKRKGPDIFLELVAKLPRESFREAAIIGPDYPLADGTTAHQRLTQLIASRNSPVKLLPGKTPDELRELFDTRAVTILPSRYDSLNLLALESLLSGVPTAIGTGAGACRYLNENYHGVPYIAVDPGAVDRAVPAILDVLANYESAREHLVSAVENAAPFPTGLTLEEIYQQAPAFDSSVRTLMQEWYERVFRAYESQTAPRGRALRTVGVRLAERVERLLLGAEQNQSLCDVYKIVASYPERSESEIDRKIELCQQVTNSVKVDRVRIWNELARLERMRGNTVLYSTYKTRVMRSLGGDRFNDLPGVASALERDGYSLESQAVLALYGDVSARHERSLQIIDSARVNHQKYIADDFEFIDDRRGAHQTRVAVIVSLYNAAPKLAFFLERLKSQTLIAENGIELVLVDSGSPTDEYRIFQELHGRLNMPVIYARSRLRETIQSAWNRGIHIARSPYLCFLGVDETLDPSCLAILANELDRDETLDWVTGSSVVTEVDHSGKHVRDVMTYNREGYDQDLVALETCYLSWVGALYRRSIHERFGYYDSTFRAAGDTEFKSRVLPWIKTKAVPGLLGIFLNYPDGQTTASPRAELEDIRAWYLHRTTAGAEYAFRNRPVEDVERLITKTLQYRKSYSTHQSTDIEYGAALCEYLRTRSLNSKFLELAPHLFALHDAFRRLDYLSAIAPLKLHENQAAIEQIIRAVQERERHLFGETISGFQIFNDNRYEQHHWGWQTGGPRYPNKRALRYLWN